MVVHAYALLDVKVGLFSQPWFFGHDAVAYRAVSELGNDRGTQVGKYPDDFVLYRIGEFNDTTGELQSCAPVNMGIVAALLANGKGS